MGELGAIRRYHYWSDRLTRQIAEDNNLALSTRVRWSAKILSVPFIGQLEVGQDTRDLRRHEIAQKLETVIGQQAVEDFVTPPSASFAKGVGAVTLAPFLSYYGPEHKAACIHTRTKSSNGCRVEVCLFGSMDNFLDYYAGSKPEMKGWRASSAWAIDEFVKSRGIRYELGYDDDQSMAVEILRTIRNEGMTTKKVMDRVVEGEWFADIFKDVMLDTDRWNQKPGSDVEQVDRILVGFPLWVRTPPAQPIKP